MTKRVSRPLSAVAVEVLEKLKTEHGISDKKLKEFRQRIVNQGFGFPLGGIHVPIDILEIDYEVQRDVIVKHILELMKKWDNRICQPAACNTYTEHVISVNTVKNEFKFKKLFIYDAQHRCVTLAVLGLVKEIPVTVVIDDDPTFASYAFRTSNSIVKKIGVPDKHRNWLRLYNLNVHDEETIRAFQLEKAFQSAKVDLMEEGRRKGASQQDKKSFKKWYFSHFDYAYKPMGADKTGKTVQKILKAMTTAWPNDAALDNCVFIGLHYMNDIVNGSGVKLPADWMTQVCNGVSTSFSNSRALSRAAERQRKATNSGSWSPGVDMYKFMREVYRMNGGTLAVKSDGNDLNLHQGVWVEPNLIPNHTPKFKRLVA